MDRKKIVIVGDPSSRKTDVLIVFGIRNSPESLRDYWHGIVLPTDFENYVEDVEVVDQAGKKRVIELALWDTAGPKEYDMLRPLSYPDTDVILVCFSVKEPDSFENVQRKWIPEITHYCPGVPFLIIGHETSWEDDTNSLQE